jgi:hypothetical protein
MSLSVERGVSLNPPGDVVTVSCLNRGTDQVLKLIAAVQEAGGEITVVTSRADSISKTGQQHLIDTDVDEGIWEEMESGLVHHGRLTPNYAALMALGGAVAAAGIYQDTLNKTVAFVAASIIAPGYEPMAKIALAIVLRRWPIVRQALLSLAVGYGLVLLSSALMILALHAFGGIDLAQLGTVPEVRFDTHPGMTAAAVSACCAAAGAVMIASFRETVLAGPLIGLAIVPVTAIMGAAIAARSGELVLLAARRLSLDMSLVIALGLTVFWLKQKLRHKRMPLV